MFQLIGLALTAVWLAIVGIWFRRSTPVLVGGLVVIAVYSLAAWIFGIAEPVDVGLNSPGSWWKTVLFSVIWTGMMFAYSPVADSIASRWVETPPTLDAFRPLQDSTAKLLTGIAIAWVLGGFLEELVFRGVVVNSFTTLLTPSLGEAPSAFLGIFVAAAGAALVHFYQGPRAMIIIAQLSVLFGLAFVLAGYNLWAAILCHGFYDTIAFIRFALKKSAYSNLDAKTAEAPSKPNSN